MALLVPEDQLDQGCPVHLCHQVRLAGLVDLLHPLAQHCPGLHPG